MESSVSFYKVGLELFVIGGTAIVEWLIGRGKKVFLDLKFNDVPETVTRATRALRASLVVHRSIRCSGFSPPCLVSGSSGLSSTNR